MTISFSPNCSDGKKSKKPNNNRLQLYQTEEYSDLYKSKKPSRVMVGHRSITNQKSPDDGEESGGTKCAVSGINEINPRIRMVLIESDTQSAKSQNP